MGEQERNFQIGERIRVVLNVEVVAISDDTQWLQVAPREGCKLWVPVDEFVERIEEEEV